MRQPAIISLFRNYELQAAPLGTGNNSAMAAKNKEPRAQGRPWSASDSVGREGLIKSTRRLLKTTPPEQIKRLDIARYAKVDPALIRYYFGDVRQLLTAVTQDILAEMRERVTAATGQPGTARERLRARIHAYIEIYSENPHFHQLMLERIVSGVDMLNRSIQQLTSLIDDGLRAGEMRDVDPRFLHTAIISMCAFFFSGKQVFTDLFPEEKNRARLIERYTDFITDIVAGAKSKAHPVTPGRRTRVASTQHPRVATRKPK
jgi:AcrR family transcriptional regulator